MEEVVVPEKRGRGRPRKTPVDENEPTYYYQHRQKIQKYQRAYYKNNKETMKKRRLEYGNKRDIEWKGEITGFSIERLNEPTVLKFE
tara:strand:+ start:135 stop:395 length:261 start_codon:yes stop_codon:yes gene_type:complete